MIDWSRIAELKNDVGEEAFDDVAVLFLDEVSQKLASLHEARGDDAAEALHFLKGCASNLGFSAFQHACEQAEANPDAMDVAALSALFDSSTAQLSAGPNDRA